MRLISKEYAWKFVMIYLDDILIFSRSKEEHVRLIMERLARYGLRLNYRKCHFGKKEVDSLVSWSRRGKYLSKKPTGTS